MKTLLVFAITLLLATSHSPAAPPELTVSSEGRGTVAYGGAVDKVDRANVVLKTDGRFTIGLVGERDTRISGRWQQAGRDTILLKIDQAAGRDAYGNGNVDLFFRRDGGYEVESFHATASTEKGTSLQMRFSFDRPIFRPRPPAPLRPAIILESTRQGRGIFRAAGTRSLGLGHAHVQLLSTGRAIVTVYGGNTLGYLGTWKNAGPGIKTLSVTGGISGETVRGAVHLTSDARSFVRIELSGTHARKYYSIEFDTPRR